MKDLSRRAIVFVLGRTKKRNLDDLNRVVLRSVDQTENPEGYINASNIDLGGTKSVQKKSTYHCWFFRFIAAQAPLSTTLGDWWAMIEEYDVSLVVMLCKLIEMNKVSD